VRGVGIATVVLMGIAAATAVVVVVMSTPDVKRYLKMRQM
jgi:hypothetical protein